MPLAMVRQTIITVDKLLIAGKQKWCDVFVTCIRSKTVAYTTLIYFIENSTRDKIRRDVGDLEAIPTELLTPSQVSLYEYLKGKLNIFEEKQINGYRQRIRGLPKYEQREPNIAFYAQLEKCSAPRTVVGELRHKNVEVDSDDTMLMDIATDFYSDLYTPSPVDESVQEGHVDHTLTDQQNVCLTRTCPKSSYSKPCTT